MNGWRVLPGVPEDAAAKFADLNTVFALQGEVVARAPISEVVRVEVGPVRYYVKRYAGLGTKPWRRSMTTPRVQKEWRNLQRFADWGLPIPPIVGYGLERRRGRFLRGALVTAEIPRTTDLAQMARCADPCLTDRRWCDSISRQLAAATRCLHQHRFAHGDLKWRNLLVDDTGKLYLIDCPSGGFWWPPFLEYRIVKDLACLDKIAKHHLSRTQRLRFYLDYLQRRRLDARDKRRLRRIVDFFAGRE